MTTIIYRAKAVDADYVVLQSSPALKGKARKFGRGYVQLRLLKVEQDATPAMGSARARGVLEVIEDPRPCYMGEGIRSEGAKLLQAMQKQADQLAR